MYQQANGSRGGRLGTASLAVLSALLVGCPGPEPRAGAGGAGGETSSSATSASSSASASSSTSGFATCPSPATCVADKPAGWDGPFAVYESMKAALMAACPAGLPEAWHGGTGPTGALSGCPSCQCLTPGTGIGCGTPHASVTSDPTCAATPCAGVDLVLGVCSQLKTSNMTSCLTLDITAPTTGAGACTGMPVGTPSFPPAQWGTTYVGCGSSVPPMCGQDKVCVAGPASPGSAMHFCISQKGMSSCPPGQPYSVPTVVDTAFVEGRTCKCDCGPLQWSCVGKATLSTQGDCGNGNPITVPQHCASSAISAGSNYSIELTQQPSVTNAACPPLPPVASGMVTGDGPITVCCMP